MTDEIMQSVPCPDCCGEGRVEVMYDVDKGRDSECTRCGGEGVIEIQDERVVKQLTGGNDDE